MKMKFIEYLSVKFPKVYKIIHKAGAEEILVGFDGNKKLVQELVVKLNSLSEKSTSLMETAAVEWLLAMVKATKKFASKTKPILNEISKQKSVTKKVSRTK